jgi:hypothetical protein
MAPAFRNRRRERARCGISVGGFLCQPKRTQAICFVGASLYLVLGGRPHFYVYKFCHLEWVLGAAALSAALWWSLPSMRWRPGRMRGCVIRPFGRTSGKTPRRSDAYMGLRCPICTGCLPVADIGSVDGARAPQPIRPKAAAFHSSQARLSTRALVAVAAAASPSLRYVTLPSPSRSASACSRALASV